MVPGILGVWSAMKLQFPLSFQTSQEEECGPLVRKQNESVMILNILAVPTTVRPYAKYFNPCGYSSKLVTAP